MSEEPTPSFPDETVNLNQVVAEIRAINQASEHGSTASAHGRAASEYGSTAAKLRRQV